MKKYFYKKTIKPLLTFLKQGMTAQKVSLTLAVGLSFGIMPSFGITLVLLILAFVLRLNVIALQIIHYAVSALQIVLFVPFLKLGQMIFNAPELPFDMNNILNMFKQDFMDTFLSVWHINLMGIIVWSFIAIPLGLAIYHLSLPYFIRHKQKMEVKIG